MLFPPPIVPEIETAVPALRGARWALIGLAGVVVALTIGFALWWLFFRPAEAIRKEKQAKVDAIAGNATADIATKALDVTLKAERQRLDVRVITEKGQNDVRHAPDAAVSAPGVAAAMRATVCLLHDKERAAGAAGSMQPDAACDQAARSDPGDVADPD